MAIDFPNAPTVGDSYTDPVSGITWYWDGEKWAYTPGASVGYLPLTGGTMTGDIILVGDANAPLEPVSLQQLNAGLGLYLPLSSPIVTGAPYLPLSSPIVTGAPYLQLNDPLVTNEPYLRILGGTLTGPLILAADPALALGAATKEYVDATKIGVIDGSNALAGHIGEVISSVVATPGVTLANGVPTNITSIALTAGDWDVHGEVWMSTVAPALTLLLCWISPTTASGGPSAAINASRFTIGGAAGFITNAAFPLRAARVSLAAPATYYLGANATGGATNAAFGNIWARRAR
jgi:hypothetical protein